MNYNLTNRWLTCPHCITNKVNFLSFKLCSVAAADETTRAPGNSSPLIEIRGSSKPSAYAGGTNLEKAVLDLPQSGLWRLLQLPSAVRYLDCLQTGSSMQYFSRSELSNEYFNSPSLASSFVSLNLTYKVGPLIIIVIWYDSYLSLILIVVCKLMKPPLVNWNWTGSNWPKNAWCCDCDEPLLWKYPNFYWKFVQIKVIFKSIFQKIKPLEISSFSVLTNFLTTLILSSAALLISSRLMCLILADGR